MELPAWAPYGPPAGAVGGRVGAAAATVVSAAAIASSPVKSRARASTCNTSPAAIDGGRRYDVWKGAVATTSTCTPLTKNATRSTPMLSDAVDESASVPRSSTEEGAVTSTVGGVVSAVSLTVSVPAESAKL